MKTLHTYQSGIDPPRTAPEWARYVFLGAVFGVLAGLATLFAVSTYYGATIGLAPAECAIFGSVTTLFLSQPVGLVGLAAGAACGGTCALVAHVANNSRRSRYWSRTASESLLAIDDKRRLTLP